MEPILTVRLVEVPVLEVESLLVRIYEPFHCIQSKYSFQPYRLDAVCSGPQYMVTLVTRRPG